MDRRLPGALDARQAPLRPVDGAAAGLPRVVADHQLTPGVVYLSRRFPPSVGGMQRLSRELQTALSARLPLRAVAWGGSQAALPLFVPLAALRAAAWLLRTRGEQVILAGDVALAPVALALGRAFRRPVAAVAHGLDITFANPAYRALVLPALRRMDRVLAISEHTRRLAIDHGVDPARCLAVGCAIDPHPLSPTRAQARPRAAAHLAVELGERPLLLSVARLVRRKGVSPFARETFPLIRRRHPDALYAVVGSGPESAAIPRGEGIHVLGRVSDAARDDLLAAADVFVMPNVAVPGDAEGFGLVAAEAAHAGVPTVATAVDSLPEAVIDGETGRLVPPDRPDLLAEAVSDLLADGARRSELSERTRAAALRHFSWDVVGDRYAAALIGCARG